MNESGFYVTMLDISAENYHAINAISSSLLKAARKSAAHYAEAVSEAKKPIGDKSKPSPILVFGRLLHSMVFEPSKTAFEFEKMPDARANSNEYKNAEESAIGALKTPIKASAWEDAELVAKAARATPSALPMLYHHSAVCEKSILFYIENELFRARPDLLIPPCDEYPSGLILDLKTTEDASPEAFSRSCWSYAYHIQAWLYCEAFEAFFGSRPDFYFLAVEKSAPYASGVYKASAEMLAVGKIEAETCIERIVRCKNAGVYPAYPSSVLPEEISLPPWAIKSLGIEDDVEIEVSFGG